MTRVSLEYVSRVMIKCFNDNLLKANPIKFQLLLYDRVWEKKQPEQVCLKNTFKLSTDVAYQ